MVEISLGKLSRRNEKQEQIHMNGKGFRKQYSECRKSGVMKEIDCPYPFGKSCPQKILLCTKYMEVCHSGVCRKERLGR
jgi:hypothetical protein